ncbi:predicted protein [Chaetomium globosum CBS 148.51]|uniref:Uncharacterized protein n=1 Tax=Chaetomium globosum (strain ATCC 6205 / CBS 148.51 / DSM 1962 / NBRC 6347 / NRRL 1970) TaxID=306901 RepID=Q2GV09_CHAGB|nr:uncharacterized protein CHGG_08195 [Chaetomium globosum CBS 148.51]EAQ86942.1 predicted protein [Chaetomium globosum CBS 148.51]
MPLGHTFLNRGHNAARCAIVSSCNQQGGERAFEARSEILTPANGPLIGGLTVAGCRVDI